MAKDPAVLFYTSDFLSATQGLTMSEIGQLIKLLCVQHQTGHLSKKTIKVSVGTVSRDVMNFFELDENGLYYNKRLEDEVTRRAKYSESRRKNIEKRYKSASTYVGTSVLHMETETETETETDTVTDTETDTDIETGKKYKLDNKIKRKYGEFENVKLTDAQYDRLKKRYADNCDRYIDDLSYYIASKGDKYKSHYAAIRSWHSDKDEKGENREAGEMSSFDTDEFFQAALKRSAEHIRRRANGEIC